MGGLSAEDVDDEFEDFRFTSNRGVAGLNYRTYLKNNDYLEAIVSYGVAKSGEDFKSKRSLYKDFESFTEGSLRGSLLYNRKIDARNTLRVGAIASLLDYNFLVWYEPEGEQRVTEVNENGNTDLIQAYAQLKHRFGTRLNVNIGLHSLRLGLANKTTLEPRIGMRWNYRDGHVITAGAGLHSRIDPLPCISPERLCQTEKWSNQIEI